LTAPGIDRGIGQDDIPANSVPCDCAGLIVPSGTMRPARNVSLTSTAPWRCSSGNELFLSGSSPELLVPSALENDHDPGFVEGGGTQLEEKIGDVLPVSARDLEATSPDILH